MRVFNGDRHATSDSYIAYQLTVTKHHLLPLFSNQNIPLDGPILEVGCGTGGNAITLAKALSVSVTGIDVLEHVIAAARREAVAADVRARFHVVDVLRGEIPAGPYGLIVMHDVIEHLPEPEIALTRLLPHLEPTGRMYVSFPPWRGPYAGHHHNARGAIRFMPYLHAIAPSIFLKMVLRPAACNEKWTEEWESHFRLLVANRLSMGRFERVVRDSGWSIEYKKTYFVRPEYLRMGLPKVSNGWLGRLPWIGECLTTGCEYLLAPN